MDYYLKYLKYKQKYLELKIIEMEGGGKDKVISPRLPAEKTDNSIGKKSRDEKVKELGRGIRLSNIKRTPSSSVDKYFEFDCTILMSRIYGILNYLHRIIYGK